VSFANLPPCLIGLKARGRAHHWVRRAAHPLVRIVQETKERNAAIIIAYATGEYSQREISGYFRLHPSTVGVIICGSKNS
jgi:hypothetical protein